MDQSFRMIETLVLEWARDRGILDHGSLEGQGKKLVEEANEVLDLGIIPGNDAELIDGIGDTLVMLIIIAKMKGYDPVWCLIQAYNTIKTRRGRMGPDGIFYRVGKTMPDGTIVT